MITKYHAKYYALMLSQRSLGDSLCTLSQSLLSASVDINPHQIEAALFAFKSPLSKGVILADEVGLGKTIEAGLVLCQYWAVGKRKILIVCPASLRKQWSIELTEKFGMDNFILDTKNYNLLLREGKNPLAQKKVIICSYNFAARIKAEIILRQFDIAVVDEAHKLRNVYRKSNKIANAIKDALTDTKKLLLTATPFQNSLMELYGLTSVIDENIFGSEKSFRAYYGSGENNSDLRLRLYPFYKRTLRKDVKEYINYTQRLPLTQEFTSTDQEYALYTAISDFLRRTDIYSVPRQQQKLTTMIIRKILASSTYALISTLEHIKARLEGMLAQQRTVQFNLSDFCADEDEMEAWACEMEDRMEEATYDAQTSLPFNEEDKIDVEALKEEIKTLQGFIDKARELPHDSKSYALLSALQKSFEMQARNGATHKALIFTESTRTQAYLKEFLEANGYPEKIVIFNGRGTDAQTQQIYADWCANHPNQVSGIKSADRRMAVVDYFRQKAEIMIATEAAGEGLNLQFCSLVINYDLPWNPQRIEQRIGRCHRYGQKYDVVVVNFVNVRNQADVRVFHLLMDKFNLFNDIFGASDEILGKAEAIDFESRIWEIYQKCRTEKEINAAFERLQADMQVEIDSRLTTIRQQVLENFDIDVQEHLRLAKQEAGAFLNRYEHIFWQLTKFVLKDAAVFDDEALSFVLRKPLAGCPVGKYDWITRQRDGIPYRLSHPLAEYVLRSALALSTDDCALIHFSPAATSLRVMLPESLQGQTGYLALTTLDVSSFDREQYCLFTGITSTGRYLTQEECEKLFLWGGQAMACDSIPQDYLQRIAASSEQGTKAKLHDIDSRNLSFFKEEETRIYRWERDVVDGIERELDTLKRSIREVERQAQSATNVDEQLLLQRKAEDLRSQKRRKRNELEDREDEVSEHRRQLIQQLENKMIQSSSTDNVFIVGWSTR
jgi:ERCC4-related helicase